MAAGIGESILFISTLIVAAAMVGVFGVVIANASDDASEQGARVQQGLDTDIAILNDPNNVATSPLVVYAKNTGSTILVVDDLRVLFNGQPSSNTDFDVLGQADDTAWLPNTILQLTINDATVASGEQRVRIVTANGIEAGFTFQG